MNKVDAVKPVHIMSTQGQSSGGVCKQVVLIKGVICIIDVAHGSGYLH